MFKFSSSCSLEMLKTRINGGIYMTQTTIGKKINWIKFDFCERFRKMIEKKCSVIVNAFNTFCRFMKFSVSINLSASCDRRRALLLWHFNKCLSQQAMKRQIRMKIFAFAKPDKIFVEKADCRGEKTIFDTKLSHQWWQKQTRQIENFASIFLAFQRMKRFPTLTSKIPSGKRNGERGEKQMETRARKFKLQIGARGI